MSVITNKWNDGSGDSINIESPSFQGNQTVKISSPVQKGTSKRSMKFIGKCKKDSSKQVILTVEQEASIYTYDLTLNSDNTEIAAKGGTANITAVLKTYRNGNLVSTDNVTPVLSGSATGFSISGTKVTASNRTTTVGSRRSIVVTGKYSNTFDGQTVSSTITIYQEANEASYGALTGGSVLASDIPASGGTSSTSVSNMSQTISYTSDSTRAGTVTYLKTSEITVSSLGTTVKARTKVGQVTVTYTGEGSVTANKTVDIYQAENKVTNSNYNPRITAYGTPTISIGSGLTAAGGSATISASVTNTETYNALYSSGATGPNQTRSVGGSLSISMTVNGNSRFSLSGNTITHSSMGTNETTDTVTIKAVNDGNSSKSATASKSITNSKTVKSTSGGIYTYGDVIAGTVTNGIIPVNGGSATATAGNGTQNWSKSATITTYQYDSGATKDVTTEAASNGTANVVPNVSSITAVASSKGTTVSAQTTVKSQAVTWSANGKSASETMYIYQEANTVSYSDITITKETPINLSATMHIDIKVSDGLSYSQKATYTSGATTYITTGANTTYSVQNPVTGFTLSNDILIVTSNKSLNPRNGFVVRINILLNGKTAIKDITYNQAAGYYTYANPVVTLTCNDVPARGGSVKTGKVTYSQTYGWNGVTTGAGVITEGEAYITWTGGVDNIPSLGTTVKSRTKVGVLGVTVNINGKSGNANADIYQAENKVINSNYNPRITAYGTPTISIGSGLTAAGGSATISASVTNTEAYNALYSSGIIGPNQTRSVGGSLSISMIANGNSRFSLSGNTITHSSMGTNETTDTAKFRCYNESDRTKYVDDSISVSNRIESYNYGSWNISISANPTSLPATGGTSTITSSCTRSKTPVYTSGSTGTATSESATPTLALTTNPGGFTLNGNKLTAANNPIGAKTATVTASYSGATSKSVSVSQAAGSDGIGYMQIQGDGTSHPIFRVGGNTRSVEPMSINETSETASDEDVSIFASIKKFLTKFV